jgi:hypothetical protein
MNICFPLQAFSIEEDTLSDHCTLQTIEQRPRNDLTHMIGPVESKALFATRVRTGII